MAHLTEIYFKLDTLQTLVKTLEQKGEKGISLTMATNDEANNYGQNVSAYVSQSKEDREAKKPKFYCGNGKVFWSDGKAPFIPTKNEPAANVKVQGFADASDDFPF
jgi:hypothetical protein